MKIKQVHIKNIHNIKDSVFDFNDVTYIIGQNGSGKSTILSAIQFCFLGKFSNSNATNSGILSNRNNTKEPIEVTVILEDGKNFIEVKREFDSKKNDLTINPSSYTIEDIVGNSSMLIFDFNEFLNLTGNKKKDYILSVLPSGKVNVNLIDKLKSLKSYTENCEEILHFIGIDKCSKISNLDVFKDVNKALKEEQSAVKVDDKSVSSTIQSLIYYDDYNGPEDIDSLEQLHSEKYLEYEKLNKIKIKSDLAEKNVNKIQSQLDSLELNVPLQDNENYQSARMNLEEAERKRGEIEGKVSYLSSEISKKEASKSQYESILKSISKSEGTCPILHEKCEKLDQSKEGLQYEYDECKGNLESLIKIRDSWSEKLESIIEDIDRYKKVVSSIEQDYVKKDYLEEQLKDYTKDIEQVDEAVMQRLQDEMKRLEEDMKQASANDQYQKTIHTLHKKELANKDKLEFLKEAIKLTGENGLVSELSKKPFENLENEMFIVQKELGLNLGDPKFVLEAKVNSFDFGFVRSDKYIPFNLLSSGEKCVFIVIFLSGISRISNTRINLVMIDDLFDHLDQNVFTTITKNIPKISDIQYIIAGVNDVENSDFLKVIDLKKSGE